LREDASRLPTLRRGEREIDRLMWGDLTKKSSGKTRDYVSPDDLV